MGHQDYSNHEDGISRDAVVFSFLEGFVWASWPGTVSMVRVGSLETAKAAMMDFLAQCEVAERLAKARPYSVPAQST